MNSTPQEPTKSHARDDTAMTYTGMPGWVKWLIIAAVVLVVVLVWALLVGGDHGPGRHMSYGVGTDSPYATALR